jgi:hypothetical protein
MTPERESFGCRFLGQGSASSIGACLIGARIAVGESPDEAARLLGASAALHDRVGASARADDVESHSKTEAECLEAIGGEAYASAASAGAKLTPEEMIALIQRLKPH